MLLPRVMVMNSPHRPGPVAGWIAPRYRVIAVEDAGTALEVVRSGDADIVVLDMKAGSVWDREMLCAEVAACGSGIPILVIGRHGAYGEVLRMLEAGADDFIRPPVFKEEVLARLRALGRRRREGDGRMLRYRGLELDRVLRTATRDGCAPVTFSRYGFELVLLLMQSQGDVLSRAAIAERLWGIETAPGSNAIEVHMSALRKLIDPDPATRLIHTVPGRGYRMHGGPPSAAAPVAHVS